VAVTRILHVATRYLRGGSEQRIRDIVGAIPEAEHHVVVGIDSDPELARRDLRPASLTTVRSLVRDPSPARDAAALRALVRLLRRARFDLLVTHQSKAGVLGRIAARIVGPPAIHSLSMANFGPGYPGWQDAVFRTIEGRLHGWTAAYVVVGWDLAQRYAGIGVPAEKLTVVRSGVSLPTETRSDARRREVRCKHGLPSGRPIVLYLGSLEARKNVLDLVPLLRRLVDAAATSGLRPFLAVAGEGPLSQQLASSLVVSGLSGDAALLGYQTHPGPLLAAADAVALLSGAEGVPQALVKAAAVGTPFVSYGVDGVSELIELGADGRIVAPGDVEGAAAALGHVLARQLVTRPASAPDLSSWRPETIASGHRRVVELVLARNGRGPTKADQGLRASSDALSEIAEGVPS
jgi:glycosyltransferase involved in cell wall biosynthesis